MRPVNIASKKAYRGVNVLTLWATADEKGYGSGVWGTYKQWAEIGAQVRKGEKSAYIVFYKEITVVGEDGDSEGVDTHLFARATPVFAAEQVDGWAAPTIDAPATIITPIEQAEAFVAATGASITHGGSRAFYRPSTDSIHLPPREAFIGSLTSSPAEAYYSTLLHELTHYTSHESRCNRQLGKRFPMAAVRPVPAPPATPDTCSPNGGGFLEPYQSNAYGPGINSDATGRPFSWQPLPGNGPADPLSDVRPDAYEPGIGMDQYGRPVQPACPEFQQSC